MTAKILYDRAPVVARALPLTRRTMLAGAGAAAAALWQPRLASARTRLDVPSGTFKPIPIALPDFAGEQPPGANDGATSVTQIITANLQRVGPVRADRSCKPIIEKNHEHRHALPRFPDWRATTRRQLVDQPPDAAGQPAQGRVPAVGCARERAARRPAILHHAGQLAAHRAIVSDAIYERLTGEKGYFDSRVVFVDESGPKDAPHQAARHHGSGRRQRALSHARRRPRAHAALLAVDAGDHLACPSAGRQPAECYLLNIETVAARGPRQLPGHELLRRASRRTASA